MLEPSGIDGVNAGVLERDMPAGVVPVRVRRQHRHRQGREALDNLADIPRTETGVDERRAVTADEEVGVNLLPVPVLADRECPVVDAIDREPGLVDSLYTLPGERTPVGV
jgi:hypothetical protein